MSVEVILGTCPHGKVLFAAVNDPVILKSYAKQMAQMLSEGFRLERTTGPISLGGDCLSCAGEKRGQGGKK